MTLYKRGPVWWTEFVFQGTRVRQSTETGAKAKAQLFEEQLRGKLHDQFVLGRTQEMTLAEAVTHYQTSNIAIRRKAASGRERSSTSLDEMRLRQFKAFFGEHEPLSKVASPARISDYKKHLLTTMQPNSANRVLNTLRAVLTAASKAGGLSRPPVVEGFSVDDARERYLTPTEEDALLAAAEAFPHLRNLVIFFLDTGARRGEALNLTWDHVHLPDTGRATVRFAHIDTKSGKPRTVPLPTRAATMLRSIRPAHPARGARVFLWSPGKLAAVPFADPKKAWNTVKKAAKLDDVRLHDLRHTYASKLIKRRVPLYEISKLLGHSDIRMTQRYAHLAQDDLEQAVSVLD